jgi:hypothetical protein
MHFALTCTTAFASALADALLNGTRVTFATVALSSADTAALTPDATELPEEVFRLQPTRVDLSEDAAGVQIRAIIPADVGGWTVRGIGLYGVGDVLLAYAPFPASYKPAGETDTGASATWTLDLLLLIGAQNAPAVLTPDVADWLADLIADAPGGDALVFAEKIRTGSADVQEGVVGFSVPFATPYDAGAVPTVRAGVRLPNGDGDYVTAAVTEVSESAFTVKLSSYVEAPGYKLDYIAISQ